MIKFTNANRLGYIPLFLSENDPRSAKEQFNANYAHGGGWQPFEGFKLDTCQEQFCLKYPGDRPMKEIGRGTLRNETIVVFEYSWVAIIQSDGSYAIARMD